MSDARTPMLLSRVVDRPAAPRGSGSFSCRVVAFAILLFAAPVIADAERLRPVRSPQLVPYLLPFVGEQSVEHGYLMSQFFLRNTSQHPIGAWFPFPCALGTGCGPNQPFELAPDGTMINPTWDGAEGVFLHLPPNALDGIAYSLRIEDVSGLIVVNRSTRGTELPVVPESHFERRLVFLNVPYVPEARSELRVFGLGTIAMTARLAIYSWESGVETLVADEEVELRGGFKEGSYLAYPSHAAVDLVPLLSGLGQQVPQGRLTIVVEAPSGATPIWAMIFLRESGDRSFTVITPGR